MVTFFLNKSSAPKVKLKYGFLEYKFNLIKKKAVININVESEEECENYYLSRPI